MPSAVQISKGPVTGVGVEIAACLEFECGGNSITVNK
jgi:hypothetical protein